MIRKYHDWTEAEDTLLSQAVMDLDSLRAEYEAREVPAHQFWSAVAGRLVPEVLVTGRACQARWRDIEARRKAAEQPAETDAWAQVAARVEVYERELGEATYDEVRGVGEKLTDIETMILNNADQAQVETLRAAVLHVETMMCRLLAELGVRMGDGYPGVKP